MYTEVWCRKLLNKCYLHNLWELNGLMHYILRVLRKRETRNILWEENKKSEKENESKTKEIERRKKIQC